MNFHASKQSGTKNARLREKVRIEDMFGRSRPGKAESEKQTNRMCQVFQAHGLIEAFWVILNRFL